MNPLCLMLLLLPVMIAGCAPAQPQTYSSVATAGQPANLIVEGLRAGPVMMKFANGELRYLQAGDGRGHNVEIVRRVYFAVRDQRFDTPSPKFDKITLVRNADSFTADMSARVTSKDVAYAWTGKIEGKSDGTIMYTVSGTAMKDFQSPRIGLNVLLPTNPLAGQQLILLVRHADQDKGLFSSMKPETFPKLPASWDPGKFVGIWYEPKLPGLKGDSSVKIVIGDRESGIEDQRQFGDSSYKMYGYLGYPFPRVAKDAKASQILVIKPSDPASVRSAAAQPDVIPVTLGKGMAKEVIPQIKLSHEAAKTGDFNTAANAKNKDAKALTWGFNPCMHLYDPDTLFENAPTVIDQVAAVRANASQARVTIDPITFQWPYVGARPDGRVGTILGAAWSVEMVKQLALAGADEGVFRLADAEWENSPAGDALRKLAQMSGKALLETTVDLPGRVPVSVLAVRDNPSVRTVFLVNRVNQRLKVVLSKVAQMQAVVGPIQLGNDQWMAGKDIYTCSDGGIQPKGSDVEIVIGPYAVLAFTLAEGE